MIPNQDTEPVDRERMVLVLAQINQKHPLKGGVLDRPTKNSFWPAIDWIPLRAAREKADQLIAQRKEQGT